MIGRDLNAPSPYRIFLTNGRGRISSLPQIIEAADDDSAIQTAQELIGSGTGELWRGSQRIAQLNGSERDDNRLSD